MSIRILFGKIKTDKIVNQQTLQCFAGVDLGKAYDIQPHLKNDRFYAALTLKVPISFISYNIRFRNFLTL